MQRYLTATSSILYDRGLSPNPFSNTLHITSIEALSVRLTDILGRQILSAEGTASDINNQLDAIVANLSIGTYLLHAKMASGKNEMFKITKQ